MGLRSPTLDGPPAPPRASQPSSQIGMMALAGLAVVCCGVPLLIGALVATGAAGWLTAQGSLLTVLAVGAAVGLLWWRSKRRQC